MIGMPTSRPDARANSAPVTFWPPSTRTLRPPQHDLEGVAVDRADLSGLADDVLEVARRHADDVEYLDLLVLHDRRSRGLGDVYKRQVVDDVETGEHTQA